MAVLRLLLRSRSATGLDAAALCASVQSVFDANNLDVRVEPGSVAHLNLAGMTAVAVGSCAEVVGAKHRALFDAVAPTIAPRGEAAVFVVGSISDGGAASGCAAHPAACPGLVMTEAAATAAANGDTAAAGRWVLAHEIGHLLGLKHDGTTRSLMWDPPTDITAEIPELSADERTTAISAALIGEAPVLSLALPPVAPVVSRVRKKKKTKTKTKKQRKTTGTKKKAAVRKKRRPAPAKRRVTTRRGRT